MSSRAQVEVGRGGDFPETTALKFQGRIRPRSDLGPTEVVDAKFTSQVRLATTTRRLHTGVSTRVVLSAFHHARQCVNFTCECEMPKRKSHFYFGEGPQKILKPLLEPLTESLDLLLVTFIAFVRRLRFHDRFEHFFLDDLRMLDD